MDKEIIYPVARGDFVYRAMDQRIARVRSVDWYSHENEFCMNLSFFEHSGEEVGRVSMPMGGPKNYEPAITFNEDWVRIEEPNFPVRSSQKWVAVEGTDRVVARSVTDVNVLPNRALKRAKKKPKARGRKLANLLSDFNPELEAASRRLTAQNLRDMARTLDGDAGKALKERAILLEDEADRIHPRF